jgi:hypothetical protein
MNSMEALCIFVTNSTDMLPCNLQLHDAQGNFNTLLLLCAVLNLALHEEIGANSLDILFIGV